MSQFNTISYDIERPTGVCAFTGRTLEPGEPYFATLVELPDTPDTPTPDHADAQNDAQTPDESSPAKDKPAASDALGLKRIDVSTQAWDQGHRPDQLFSYWKTTVPQPTEKKKLFVDDAVLMNLLHRLADTDKPQRLAFRYVLALILMRKKLIRYDGTDKRPVNVDGEEIIQEWWRFTPKLDLAKGRMGKWNEREQIDVLDPGIDAGQIEHVTAQLGEILEAEL